MNAYSQNSSWHKLDRIKDEIRGMRTEMAGSQSGIELAIVTQSQAVQLAVATVDSDITTSIESQKLALETALGEVKQSIETSDTNNTVKLDELKGELETQTVELTSLGVKLDTLVSDVQAGNTILADITPKLEEIRVLTNDLNTTTSSILSETVDQGITLDSIKVEIEDINISIDAINASIVQLETSIISKLTETNTKLESIDENTDELEAKFDSLITEVQTGNISLNAIKADTATIITELQGLKTVVDNIDGDLDAILNAINTKDATDDDINVTHSVVNIGCVTELVDGEDVYVGKAYEKTLKRFNELGVETGTEELVIQVVKEDGSISLFNSTTQKIGKCATKVGDILECSSERLPADTIALDLTKFTEVSASGASLSIGATGIIHDVSSSSNSSELQSNETIDVSHFIDPRVVIDWKGVNGLNANFSMNLTFDSGNETFWTTAQDEDLPESLEVSQTITDLITPNLKIRYPVGWNRDIVIKSISVVDYGEATQETVNSQSVSLDSCSIEKLSTAIAKKAEAPTCVIIRKQILLTDGDEYVIPANDNIVGYHAKAKEQGTLEIDGFNGGEISCAEGYDHVLSTNVTVKTVGSDGAIILLRKVCT